jgi:hypothetical protein
MREVGTIVKRYAAVYATVKDEDTANRGVAEIRRMTARLRELADEIGKIPYRTGQETHTLAFQTELTQLQTAQLTNPEMQRVLGDLDLGIPFIAAHQGFVTEGLMPLAQAILARQPGSPPSLDQATPPPPKPSDK